MDHAKAESLDRAPGTAAPAVSAETTTDPKDRSWKRAIVREVRSRPFGYGVLAVALLAGPFVLRMIFPEVTPVQAIVGGLAFGVYLALCAVPQKFM